MNSARAFGARIQDVISKWNVTRKCYFAYASVAFWEPGGAVAICFQIPNSHCNFD